MAEAAAARDWKKIALVTVPAIVLAGSASGWLSNSGYGNDWFDGLVKPPFMPPAWVFPTVWTALYALMGAAVAMIIAAPESGERRLGLTLFAVQLALNYAWSPIFAAHDMSLGSTVILVMLVIALAAAGLFRRIRAVAGMLMLPYLLWLCFAFALNSSIDRLNSGAGTSLFG